MTERQLLEQNIDRAIHTLLRLSTARRSQGRMLQIKDGIHDLDRIWSEYRDSLGQAVFLSDEKTLFAQDAEKERQAPCPPTP